MIRRVPTASALLLVLLALWLMPGVAERDAGSADASGAPGKRASWMLPDQEPARGRVAKVSERAAEAPRATHLPGRLRDFLLPPVEIDGLSLEEALARLVAAYQEACWISGERPVRLKFSVPSGAATRLTVKLGNASLDGSVRMLAGLAGLTVRRDEAEYVFELPESGDDPALRKIEVPPDFLFRLKALTGGVFSHDPFAPLELRPLLESLGSRIDPAAVSLSGMTLTARDAETHAALKALVDGISAGGGTPAQVMLETRIAKMPAGAVPDEAGMRGFLDRLAAGEIADARILPGVTARLGETADIRLVSELIVPTNDAGTAFGKHEIGTKLGIRTTGVAFGQRLEVNYSDTDFDAASGKVEIRENASIDDSGYTPDTMARSFVQTHPDGSRTVLLVTPTFVDATGRPLGASEN